MKSWAKIRGAYVLSRRNIKRIIAAITAAVLAFSIATTALSADDESLSRRADDALCTILTIKDSLPSEVVRISVSDDLFDELAELFFMFKPLIPPATSAGRTVPAPPLPPRAATIRHSRRPRPGELRQEDVAAVFGVTRQTVVRWESTQTVDGPDNTSNPWGYYRSLRTNPELRGSFEMLANMARDYLSARAGATRQGQRFRMTFVSFKENWFRHNAAGKM